MKTLGAVTRTLSCQLTESEIRMLGEQLAEAEESKKAEQEEQATARSEMKARLQAFDEQIGKLVDKIRHRSETRPVAVVKTLLDDGRVQEVRTDTGEIIATRAMEDEERRLSLFPVADATPPDAVSDMVAEANRAGYGNG